MLERRSFLATTASLPMIGATVSDVPPLRDLAAARNIVFGTEVTLAEIASDPLYAALVARECAMITPGIEAKWGYIEPADGAFRFGPMDSLAGFARGAGLLLHMHNFIWAVGLPHWTLNALRQGDGASIIERHARAVAGRYKDLTDSWDVVNEPVDPRWPSDEDGLCLTPWRQALGPQFVPTVLSAMHSEVPAARLLINDDDLEYDAPDREHKRATYLRLIETWLKHGAKLHGFGLEAHLKPWLPIAEKAYRHFLHELAQFGLKLYVTELDVCDRTLSADVVMRDGAVADLTRRYLDMVLDEPSVCSVMTWGLSDRTSWMLHDPAAYRQDGLQPRPLPYDSHLRAKPMREAIAAAFRGARGRPRA
jgi:endo-1,4-beta-xylanase